MIHYVLAGQEEMKMPTFDDPDRQVLSSFPVPRRVVSIERVFLPPAEAPSAPKARHCLFSACVPEYVCGSRSGSRVQS